MVKHVECFCPELQRQPIVNWELSAHRKVHLPCSKASYEVTRSVPVAGTYITEGIRIDRTASWARKRTLKIGSIDCSALRSIDINWLTGDDA